MRYGSVCSGIEAATAAWHHLRWEPAFFSEIEKFPRAVLEHHYPDVPLHGDFTTIEENQYGKIDLLVGGTPCQSFSVAGLRGGLDDERGNLALEFCRLAQRERPRWIVWENVPGVLSSNGGRDFGSILGALEDLGYGLAYRVLDAQYFGVAQRRRRVFVVGYLGDWRCAAAVLFERHSLSGHPAPSREKRQDAAGGTAKGASERGGRGGDRSVVGTLRTRRPGEGGVQGDFDHIVPVVSPALNTQSGSHHAPDTKAYVAFTEAVESNHVVAFTETADCLTAAYGTKWNGNASATNGSLFAFDTTQISSPHNYSNPQPGDPCHPLAAGAHAPAIAFSSKDYGADATEDCSPTLRAGGHNDSHANAGVPPAVVYPINMQSAAKNGEKSPNGLGIGAENDPSPTLGANDKHAVAYSIMPMNSGKDYKARETDVAQPLMASGPVGGNQGGDFVTYPIDTQNMTEGHNSGGKGFGAEIDPSFTLTKGHSHAVAYDLRGREGGSQLAGPHDTANIRAASGGSSKSYVMQPEAMFTDTYNGAVTGEVAATLGTRSGDGISSGPSLLQQSAVRRLTPVECERLQGFPDNFTAIPWGKKVAEDCPDGPRYKALGNSMAVPVMRWIGERIQLVDDLISVL
jgi:DNA (cytosine-5)-methyltransferase 1